MICVTYLLLILVPLWEWKYNKNTTSIYRKVLISLLMIEMVLLFFGQMHKP